MYVKNDQNLYTVVRSAPIGICILDSATLVAEMVNEKFIEVAGKSSQEILGKFYWDAFAEVRHLYEAELNKVVATGVEFHADEVEIVLIRQGQPDRIFVTFVYSAIRDDAGKVNKISIWVLENTAEVQARNEVKKANEKLKASQYHLRSMVKQAPVGMCIVSGSPLYVEEINDMFLQIIGKKRDDFLSTPYWDVNAEAKAIYEPITDKVIETGQPFYAKEHEVMLIRNGNAEQVHVDFVYEPMLNESGQPFAIMIVATEVTEMVNARKKLQDFNEEMLSVNEVMTSSNEEIATTLEELAEAHAELEEINHRLRIALDAGSLGSTEVDLATGKMTPSIQFKRNYGQPIDQPFDYPALFECMLPQYREPIKKLVQTAIAERSVYKAEYEIKWPDGSIHWISAHGKARYNSDGKAYRMVGVTADITENKLFEQRKDDFLSIASHELKTPMTSLKASLQLLKRMKDRPDSKTKEMLLDQSVKSMEKMSELIDELLQVNRLEVGQLKLNPTTFVLAQLLDECCSHVRLEGKYELVLEGDQDLKIYADQHRIEQVVVNLVNNAVKYAPDSPKIILRIEKNTDYVKVLVIDFGPGIPKEKIDKLFDRYFQVEQLHRNSSGLGLGLYISQEIIQRHNGKIGVDSVLGEGATFWFTLPLKQPDEV